jgi:hypothetical protein
VKEKKNVPDLRLEITKRKKFIGEETSELVKEGD